MNDRTTARLVEQNCLAHRLFTKPAATTTATTTPGSDHTAATSK